MEKTKKTEVCFLWWLASMSQPHLLFGWRWVGVGWVRSFVGRGVRNLRTKFISPKLLRHSPTTLRQLPVASGCWLPSGQGPSEPQSQTSAGAAEHPGGERGYAGSDS